MVDQTFELFGQATSRMSAEEKEGNLILLLEFPKHPTEKPFKTSLILAKTPIKNFWGDLKTFLPHLKNYKFNLTFTDKNGKLVEISELKNAQNNHGLAMLFTEHPNYKQGVGEQQLELSVNYFEAKSLYIYVYVANFGEKESTSFNKALEKIKTGAAKTHPNVVHQILSSYDSAIDVPSDDMLVIATDENFIDAIAEKEGAKAHKIFIYADPKNEKALAAQSKLSTKIVPNINNKNFELLMPVRNFDFPK